MHLSIQAKLFLTLVLSALLAISGVFFGFQHSFTQGLLTYLDQRDQVAAERMHELLSAHYSQAKNWDALLNNDIKWNHLQREAWGLRNSLFNPSQSFSDTALFLQSRFILYDKNYNILIGLHKNSIAPSLREIYYSQKVVGYLGYIKRTRLIASSELHFAADLEKSLSIISLLALLMSALLAIALARHLVRPIQALRNGTHELSIGNYSAVVEISTHDELSELSNDFNQLAKTLKSHESDRKQWIVDIAHELRTPLSILRGEIEAIEDGIEPLSLESIKSLHDEVLHLQRLVEDLYDLSMSDIGALSYRKYPQNIIEILDVCVERFQLRFNEAGIKLSVLFNNDSIEGLVDYRRLQQLFDNLLQNSLRYTDSPGHLFIDAKRSAHQLVITFDDTTPGVDDYTLEKMFDRLYRAESSRNRTLGGAGIGLSICRNIMIAHEGTIIASHSLHGGVRTVLTFPI